MERNKKIKFSIKYKLLVLLTSLPVISLTVYLIMASNLFQSDKIAYIFDSSSAVSNSISKQFNIEIESFLGQLKPILLGLKTKEVELDNTSKKLFDNQSKIEGIIFFSKVHNNFQMKKSYFLEKKDENVNLENIKKYFSYLVYSKSHLSVKAFKETKKHFLISSTLDNGKIIVIGIYKSIDFLSELKQPGVYSTFLLNSRGEVEAGSETIENYSKNLDFITALKDINKNVLPKGASEIVSSGNKYLVSYNDTVVEGLRVYSLVDKSKALSAVKLLLIKSLLFFVVIIAITLIVSIMASSSVTWKLRELYDATIKIAEGNFNIRIEKTTDDEVGGLVEGFNFMSEKVHQLLSETAEKARMESELQTTQMIQETLYPEEVFNHGPIKIRGYFEPASECGGDWWSYSQIGNKLFLWIGDATGHGAPAALITSAAKSAATVIEHLPQMSPAKAMGVLNEAIGKTAKGKVLMTFFIASIDLETGEMIYANASHDPPYLIKKSDEKLTRKSLIPLLEANGPRLGDQKNIEYKEEKLQLQQGDTLVLYTDGIIDVSNKEGKVWGERNFLKTIVNSAKNSNEIDERLSGIKNDISLFRGEEDLVDDITLFICEYKKVS